METSNETVAVETPAILAKNAAYWKEQCEKTLATRIKTAKKIYDAWQKLKEFGVKGVPDELRDGDVCYGFTVEVAEPSDWGKIHRAVGKLYVSDKSPIMEEGSDKKRGRKLQKIRLTLTPEESGLGYNLYFRTERKLTKKDKCVVKTVVNKSVQVVCNIG